MTAEEVRSGEAAVVEVEDDCRLDISSSQDLPMVNGINKHVVGDDGEQPHASVIANGNGNAREDLDNSYVFVTGGNGACVSDVNVVLVDKDVSLPEKDLEVKVEQLNGGICQSFTKEDNFIPQGNDVLSAVHCVSPKVAIGNPKENGDYDRIQFPPEDANGDGIDVGTSDRSEEPTETVTVESESQLVDGEDRDHDRIQFPPEDSVGGDNANGDEVNVATSDRAEDPNGSVTVQSESQLAHGELKVDYGNDSKPSFKMEMNHEHQSASDLPTEISEHEKSIITLGNPSDSLSEDMQGKQDNSNSALDSRQAHESENEMLTVSECDEVMEVTSADQIDLKPSGEAQSNIQSQIILTTSCGSESGRLANGEQNLREENMTNTSVVDAGPDGKCQTMLSSNFQSDNQVHEPAESTYHIDVTLGTDAVNNFVSDESQESQIVSIKSVQAQFDQEHEPVNSTNHVDAPLGMDVSKPVLDENQESCSVVTDSMQIVSAEDHVPEKCTDHTALVGAETVNNSVPYENQGSQSVATVSFYQGHELAVPTDHVDATLEAETVNTIVLGENKESQTVITHSIQISSDQGNEANPVDHIVSQGTESVDNPVPDGNQESEIVNSNAVKIGFYQEHELQQPTNHVNVLLETEAVDDPVSDENQESEVKINDTVQTGFDQGLEQGNCTDQTGVWSEAEDANYPLLDENKENNGSLTTSDVKDYVFQANEVNKWIDGCQPTPQLNGSLEDAKTLADCRGSEIETAENKVGNSVSPVTEKVSQPPESIELESEYENSDLENRKTVLSFPNSDEKSKDIVENSPVEVEYSNGPDNDMSSEAKDRHISVDSEEKVPQYNDTHISPSAVDNGLTHVESISSNNLDITSHVDDFLQDGSSVDAKSSELGKDDVSNGRDRPRDDATLSKSEGPNDSVLAIVDVKSGDDQSAGEEEGSSSNVICQQTVDIEAISDGLLTSLPEGSTAVTNGFDGQSTGLEVTRRPFNFFIRVPRFDDGKLKEQVSHAKVQVDEKTKFRDAFKVEMQKIRDNCRVHGTEYEAAKSEERDARRLVKLKRQDIDSVQSVINRVKNAISVEEIDVRICSMEHMIGHETLPLKEEKQLIREIKQLKHIREQLSSNMGSLDEVQQALDQKSQFEERLKILKKELNDLKGKVSKAEIAALAAGKKYEHESKKLQELQAQFRAADDTRQDAYSRLLSLKKQSYDKNKYFRTHRDGLKASNDYARKGDTEALHHLCTNQVEAILELWNKDDVFRKEYVICNLRSTLRRLGTTDGRSLGPDEEPPVLPSYVDKRVDRSVCSPDMPISVSQVPSWDQEKEVLPAKVEMFDGKPFSRVAEEKNRTTKTRKPAEPILFNGSVSVSDRGETEVTKTNVSLRTKEEQELAKKEEELKKKEAEDNLKEQRRMEELAKAKEAQERKKRNAEKAQFRAEIRAQREAEQKEKEREKKRLRKKERKKEAVAELEASKNNGENAPISETVTETSREHEVKESASMVTKKSQKAAQFTKQSKTKSIPPPLRNKGKKRMQQWIWFILTALLIIALFLLGNIGFFTNLGKQTPRF